MFAVDKLQSRLNRDPSTGDPGKPDTQHPAVTD